MLKNLEFQNFKCFKRKTRVNFGGVTLFYGKNSSGKTTAVKGAVLFFKALKSLGFSSIWDNRYLESPVLKIPSSRNSSLSFGSFHEIPTDNLYPVCLGAKCYNTCEEKKILPTNGFSIELFDYQPKEKLFQTINSFIVKQLDVFGSKEDSIFSVKLNEGSSDLASTGWSESYFLNRKAEEWVNFEKNFVTFLMSAIDANDKGKQVDVSDLKNFGFAVFKKSILSMNKDWESRERWFYGKQEPFDSDDEFSIQHYYDEYDFEYSGDGDDPMPAMVGKDELKILQNSRSFLTYLQKVSEFRSIRSMKLRLLEYAYYLDPNELGWIDANYHGRTYGKSFSHLIFQEVQSAKGLEFTFIPLNFLRKRIYDLDEVYSKSNEESPEYNISNFLKFISDSPKLRQLNEVLKTLDVGFELLPPDFEILNGFVEIKIRDNTFVKNVNIYDIGFGTTHFVFTIAAILEACDQKYKQRVLFLEEPEVHCHPDLQGKLATFILSAISSGTQIVIDTHSEIFALAFSKAIRNPSAELGEFINYQNQKVPSVVFNYFNKGSKSSGTSVVALRLDANGEFVDEDGNPADWPDEKGFFGQRYDYS